MLREPWAQMVFPFCLRGGGGGEGGAERMRAVRSWFTKSAWSSESRNVLNHPQLTDSECPGTGPRDLPIVHSCIPGSSEDQLGLRHLTDVDI